MKLFSWVVDYSLLPGDFSEKKIGNASTVEVIVIFIPGGKWNFTFKCGLRCFGVQDENVIVVMVVCSNRD